MATEIKGIRRLKFKIRIKIPKPKKTKGKIQSS